MSIKVCASGVRRSLVCALLVGLLATGCGGGGGGGGGGSTDSTPATPTVTLNVQSIKTFRFTWTDVSGETEYRLLEDPTGVDGYTQIATLAADSSSYDLVVPLHLRVNARYIVQACNSDGCASSAAVNVSGTLASAVGYVKASNTEADDWFGAAVALSADGGTLAVSATAEDSSATGIGGNQADNSAAWSGAVYVFIRSGAAWSQQAYLKASNTDASDLFGHQLALSADGNTLAVSTTAEDSNATGIDGDQADNSLSGSGAVYVFTRSGATWSQQAYVKASNTGNLDGFGDSLALSADGNTLAVGATREESAATGIDGNQADNSANSAGAVYVFTRSGGTWSQQAYVKASNTDVGDTFGHSVALSADGNTLAVGAHGEASNATGINGNQADNSAQNAGAAYVFTRSGVTWSQQAYIKAAYIRPADRWGERDHFGVSIALSADGNTLAVGALNDSSAAAGIDGDQTDTSAEWSGAVHVFTRSGVTWSQQAYIKAANPEARDQFGGWWGIALSADGNTLAVGAIGEDGSTAGINGDQTDNADSGSGAVYVFARSGGTWSQRAYLKASNNGNVSEFGVRLALSGDGTLLAVSTTLEPSSATGVNGDQTSTAAVNSGAVYLY